MSLDYDYFYKWAKRELNIDLDAYKEKQLQRRIGTVMRSAKANNLKEYSILIAKDEEIKRIFLDYITINVTEFFRNEEIFRQFENILKDNLSPKFKRLNIWSAACSIGAEPYSVGLILDKHNIKLKDKILATDIDEIVLKKAKKGIFQERDLKNMDVSQKNKYFQNIDGNYQIKDEIKNMVNFKKHDLILDNYPSGFHAVICRNVTIYFKNEVKDMIYEKIYKSLVPGGVFFIGATETIYNPEKFGFKKLSTFIYEKV